MVIRKFAKKVIVTFDNHFRTNLLEKAIKLENAIKPEEVWRGSNFLNAMRRRRDPAIVKLRYKLGLAGKNALKLHVGCGDKHFEGYINVDLRKTKATDVVCDIRELPYPDNSVELIETYHVIEHLPRHYLPKTLRAWYRILKPGGKLIIECPDFDEDVKEYMEGNEKRLDSIFGLQRFFGDAHMFGYNFRRLERLLKTSGFKDIWKKEPQDSHAKHEPCLRVECVKRR